MKNIHLLLTNKPSRLVKIYNDVNRETFTLKLDIEVNDSFKEYVNVYITSDEEIKEGDVVKIPCGVGKVKELIWKFGNDNPSYIVEDIFIYKLRYGQKEGELQINSFRYEDVKKIILTTDKELIKDDIQEIDDEFLEWFVKNPNCEEVEVIPLRKSSGYYDEKEVWHWDFLAYKIIIPKEDDKQETLEDYVLDSDEHNNLKSDDGTYLNFHRQSELLLKGAKLGSEWKQEQDKNLYTEEDLLNFGAFVRIEDKKEKRLFLIQDYFKKWVEQYKKK